MKGIVNIRNFNRTTKEFPFKTCLTLIPETFQLYIVIDVWSFILISDTNDFQLFIVPEIPFAGILLLIISIEFTLEVSF
jgi:hypothetical protein